MIRDKIPLSLIGEVIDKLKDAKYSKNWILSGDTTIYKSKKVTNRRQYFWQTKNYSN